MNDLNYAVKIEITIYGGVVQSSTGWVRFMSKLSRLNHRELAYRPICLN